MRISSAGEIVQAFQVKANLRPGNARSADAGRVERADQVAVKVGADEVVLVLKRGPRRVDDECREDDTVTNGLNPPSVLAKRWALWVLLAFPPVEPSWNSLRPSLLLLAGRWTPLRQFRIHATKHHRSLDAPPMPSQQRWNCVDNVVWRLVLTATTTFCRPPDDGPEHESESRY